MAATTLNWFTSSLILSLFFLMHLRLKDAIEIQINPNDFVYAPHKEFTTVATRKMRQHGGRNMMQVQDEAFVLGGEVNEDTPRISGQNDEGEMRERLHREANKMVNLMHKDYNGMGKPRRKPPVNNDEPSH